MSAGSRTPAGHLAGLCATCAHHRVVQNRRGSRFYLCERSRSDPSYPRYPPLPVLRCRGWEPSGAGVREAEQEHPEANSETTKEEEWT